MSETNSPTFAHKGRSREIVFAALTLGASVLFALIVIPNGVTTPTSVKHLPLSPAFLPYVLTGAIGIFALVHILEAVFAAHIPDDDDTGLGVHPQWKSRALMLSALLLLYLILPDQVGMLLTAILVTIILLTIGGERRLIVLLGVGIIVPMLVYLFFAYVAQVPLPMGIFEEWV